MFGDKKRKKLGIIILVGSIGTLLGLTTMALAPQSNTASAAEQQFSKPSVKGQASLAIVTGLKETNSTSQNPNIVLSATYDNSTLSFSISNKGDKLETADVDRWDVLISGSNWTGTLFSSDSNPKISAPINRSAEIARIDMSKHADFFELFPGNYTLDLVGWKWEKKDFGKYTKEGNFAEYKLSVNLTISYDVDAIKASPEKLLKADNMKIGIDGEGRAYEVSDNTPKKVSLYLVNNNNTSISGVIKNVEFTMWNTDHRYNGDGTTTIIDPREGQCDELKPGEQKLIDTFDFSKNSWPIAENGIAKKLGSEEAVPGTYIVYMQVVTMPCSTNTGELPGSVNTLISAFEVKP